LLPAIIPAVAGFWLDQLRNFENIAARSLESFRFMDSEANEEELIYYLRMPCLQSLCKLKIISSRVTNQTLAAFQYSIGSENNLKGNHLPEVLSMLNYVEWRILKYGYLSLATK
jgi:hypothetical protein